MTKANTTTRKTPGSTKAARATNAALAAKGGTSNRPVPKANTGRKAATPQVKAAPAAPAEEAPAPAPLPKCATARVQVAKPQAKMLRKIASIGKHPGKALRIKRFADYAVGMTLQHCRETDGLDHLDVLFYVDHGLMTLADATEKEVEAAVEAWAKAKEATAKAA